MDLTTHSTILQQSVAAVLAQSPLASEGLLGVSSTEHGWRIEVASDGLSLDDKITVEKHILQSLPADMQEMRAYVYFRRRDPSTSLPGKTPGRSGGGEKLAPFGLKREPQPIAGVRDIILVASGKGGVGKSTVSVNLAAALAKAGSAVGYLDADIYGPSGPLMFGVKGRLSVDAEGKLEPQEAHGVKVVSMGLLSDTGEPAIWRGPMVSKAIEQLCYRVAWGELDQLVVDLPPGTGDVQMTLIEKLPIRGAIIVTTPQQVALIDARKAVRMFRRLNVPIFGVVENMSFYRCRSCSHEEHLFGREALVEFLQAESLPLLATLPLVPELRESGDSGTPVAVQTNDAFLAEAFTSLARHVQDVQWH